MAKKQKSDFNLIGQFRGFVTKDDKIKYLKLATADKEYRIKLSKEIRQNLYLAVYPGCCLQVSGKSQQERKGKVKLKADTFQVSELASSPQASSASVPQPPLVKPKPKASVLVCQKSSCWKRGGKEVCQALAESLSDRHLTDEVRIKLTGCLKRCKKGPNVVMMPNKAVYSKVQPAQVPALVEEHFIVPNRKEAHRQ
ncbi:MAG: (2Fe-2S) ferredoxin domain-containing protein [Cyanophyceae cyanobacterium]